MIKSAVVFVMMSCGIAGAMEVWQSDDIWTLAEASADPKTDDITRSRCNAKIRLLRTKIQEQFIDKKVAAESAKRTDEKYAIYNSCNTGRGHTLHLSVDGMPWQVISGSQSFTLSEFVSSGKFCLKNGGHLWTWIEGWKSFPIERNLPNFDCGTGYQCVICLRCRQRVKKQKEIDGWED